MSVLEIIIYSILGAIVVTYLTIMIVQAVKERRKKHENERNDTDM